EGDADCVGELVHARLERPPGVLVVGDLLGHKKNPLRDRSGFVISTQDSRVLIHVGTPARRVQAGFKPTAARGRRLRVWATPFSFWSGGKPPRSSTCCSFSGCGPAESGLCSPPPTCPPSSMRATPSPEHARTGECTGAVTRIRALSLPVGIDLFLG